MRHIFRIDTKLEDFQKLEELLSRYLNEFPGINFKGLIVN